MIIMVLNLFISLIYAKEDLYVIPKDVQEARDSFVKKNEEYKMKMMSRLAELQLKKTLTEQEQIEKNALEIIILKPEQVDCILEIMESKKLRR